MLSPIMHLGVKIAVPEYQLVLSFHGAELVRVIHYLRKCETVLIYPISACDTNLPKVALFVIYLN